MNFDKESKSEEKHFYFILFFFFFFGGGGGGGVQIKKKKKENNMYLCIHLLFVFTLSIKSQVPSSSGSLVLTQTKGVMDRYGA